MNLEFSSLSGLRSQAHFLDFYQQVFFLSSHQHGHFWNLITQSYVWFLAHHRRSVLGNREQFSLYIYWPVPSPVAAVLLHIWNLPNEITRKQSCCSERCCPRSGIYSPVAAVLVQIWHILNFRQDPSWLSSPPVSQISGLTRLRTSEISAAILFSQFSLIWPFLKFDYPVLRMISRLPERLSSSMQQ